MNRGLLGPDAVSAAIGFYQSPYVPLSSYAGARKYIVPHPLNRRPIYAGCQLRCRVQEGGYLPRDETIYVPTDSTAFNGLVFIYRPDRVEFVFQAVGLSIKNKSTGITFSTTPANWELSLLVLA
ncbi:MAG TPA: hypothetical protein VHA35_20540 [Dongiaceae bacterium]|jgi:hypothetical protein|nr:hypothetical protein [Dongiaceae bacterium]